MADGGAPTARDFRDVELGELHPSPTNPRRLPTDAAACAAKVADIVATIRVDEGGRPEIVDGKPRGIREPLCVRERGAGGFEIIKGERRYRASVIAGLRILTCEVVRMTDAQVLEEQLVEDGARVDLTPLEEAAALARLREEYGLDVAAIADRTGKTVRLVRQRLALHDHLVDEGKALLAAAEISPPLALTLCTLSPSAQREVVAEVQRRSDAGPEPLAGREVQWEIKRRRFRLVDGGFPLDDATLVPAAGACTTCPKRSGTQAALFADGLDDADVCADAACFEGKRAARTEQIKASAKAQGFAVVSKPAEVKKLFPYGDRLAHDSAFVDLDDKCDLVRPPEAVPTKSQGRKGGPEVCTGAAEREREAADGRHDFEHGVEYAAEEFEDDEGAIADERGCREALAAGCGAWVVCDYGCGAWQEVNPRPGATPRGWKPPTWREVLGKALAQVSPTEAVKPTLVAEDGKGGVHELADKKAAVKLLQSANLVFDEEAQNEIRQSTPAKKPGELDKFELERKAREAAEEATLDAIVTKAAKKAPDLKFWRLLSGLCLAHWHNGDVAERARARRGLDKMKTKADVDKALREWVAAEKDEGALRGFVVELLAERSYGDDSPRAIAARFYGVDVKALEAEAKTRIKAEAKEKAKTKAAKAAPAKKTAKASPAAKTKGKKATSPLSAPEEEALAADAAPLTLTQVERERITREILAYIGPLVERSEVGETVLVDSLCDDEPSEEPKVRLVLAELVESGALALELLSGTRLYSVKPVPTDPLCPLTRADVVRLGASIGHPDPHEGAHSPEIIWGCVEELRQHPPLAVATREQLYKLRPSAGTLSFDLAIAWMLQHDEARRVSGRKGASKEVLVFGEEKRGGIADRDVKPENVGPGMLGRGVDPDPTTAPPCRICKCTETTACSDGAGGYCSWKEPGLCSVCANCITEALKICRKAQSATAVDKALSKRWADGSRRKTAVEQLVATGELRREGSKLVAVEPKP